MKSLLVCLLFVNFQNLRSQSLQWYEGVAVLSTNEVIQGSFSLEPLHDIVVYREEVGNTIYPPHKIRSLYFYDYNEDINRRFISLKENNLPLMRYRLFEIVVLGEVTILRRQTTKGRRLSNALDFTYLIRYQDEIIPLSKFRKRIFPLLSNSLNPCLADYMREYNLRPYLDTNAIQIIEFYNSIIKSAEVFAKQ